MPDFTPGGIPFPIVDDKIKDGTSPSALVEDFKTLALGADTHAHNTAEAARVAAVNAAATDATSKANTAKTDAIADATTKYGGLPGRVAAIEPKKCVRLEAGAWVWDTTAGTHYLIPDHDGSLVIRATPIPVPAATPSLNW